MTAKGNMPAFFFLSWALAFAPAQAANCVARERLDRFIASLVAPGGHRDVESFIDDRAYAISFLESCTGLGAEARTRDEVLGLLLELAGAHIDKHQCKSTSSDGVHAKVLLVEAGLSEDLGNDTVQAIRSSVPATGFCTTLIEFAIPTKGGPTRVPIVVAWANFGGEWRVVQVDMVCV